MARTFAKVKEIEVVYLTVSETKKYLGFASVDTQRKWRESGMLPYFLIGRQILYKKSDVDRLVERHRIGPERMSKRLLN